MYTLTSECVLPVNGSDELEWVFFDLLVHRE